MREALLFSALSNAYSKREFMYQSLGQRTHGSVHKLESARADQSISASSKRILNQDTWTD